jgi:hypothetical protein
MPTPLDPAAAAEAFKKFLAATAQATVESVRSVAVDAQARATRQAALADRLEAAIGKDDARVIALRRSSGDSRLLAQGLERAAATIPTGGVLRPRGGITFTGRVTDAAGAVVPGVSVRLTDPTGVIRAVAPAVTDETGAFSLAVPAGAVDAGAANLALVVEDPSNRVTNVPPAPVQLKPGVLQRVDFRPAAPPPQPAPPAPTPAPAPGPALSGRRKTKGRRKNPQG